ncbi:MAG: septal ring lytic transglycosylase RlpA family protein [bacterium]
MIPLALRKTLAPFAQRVMNGLSSQFKRFARPVKTQTLAAKATSHPRGLVMRQMPAFSALLEQAQASNDNRPQGVALAQLAQGPPDYPKPQSSTSQPLPSAQARNGAKYMFYTVRPGDTLWSLGVKRFAVDPEVLAKENAIENPSKLQAGQRIRVPLKASSPEQTVVASWYGHEHHGKPMANGEPFNMHAATIAHKELPLGTKVELKNPETGQKVLAVVTDRGPYIEGRDVDLSYGLARRLNMVEKGVGKLVMRVLA